LGKKEFSAFMKKAIEEPRADVEDKRDKFRCDLYDLYDNIEEVWLKEYIDSGEVEITAERAWFFEGHREYKLPSRHIEFGKKDIWIQPSVLTYEGVGSLSIEGQVAAAYISLQRYGGPWKIYDAFLGTKDEELNEETFLKIFMKVSAG
jgi:hypothetical protein